MKLTKQKQQHLVVVGLLTLLVCGGIWFGLLQSQDKRLAAIAAKAGEARDKETKIRKLVASSKQIESELAAKEQQLNAIEDTFAKGADLYSWAFSTLQELKPNHEVEIPQVSRQVLGAMNLMPDFPYRQATYSIRGVAYYEALGRFLADFENKFPYFRLLNLDIEPDAGASKDGEMLSFRMDIAALIKPGAASAD